MLGRPEARVKLAHVLAINSPITPIEAPKEAPVVLGAKEVWGLEECIPHRVVVPTEERSCARLHCYAVSGCAGRWGFVGVTSGCETYVYERGSSIKASGNKTYFQDGFASPETRWRSPIVETNHSIAKDLLLLRARGKAGFKSTASGERR